ncbi:MAG: hypothetical protein HYY25_09895 [Candidatus Wallbacteria bacterium]|nr:hypothetical protein [Candidatus Wallbacteria bacterium]
MKQTMIILGLGLAVSCGGAAAIASAPDMKPAAAAVTTFRPAPGSWTDSMIQSVRAYVLRLTDGRPETVPQLADLLKRLDTTDFSDKDNYVWLKSWAYSSGWKPLKLPATPAGASSAAASPPRACAPKQTAAAMTLRD